MSHASRIKAFVVVNRCLMKRKPFEKLNHLELEFVFIFMNQHSNLSDAEFKGIAHYLFIDGKDGRDRFPHHIEIIEVLMDLCKVS